jgi:hypothetical protein
MDSPENLGHRGSWVDFPEEMDKLELAYMYIESVIAFHEEGYPDTQDLYRALEAIKEYVYERTEPESG